METQISMWRGMVGWAPTRCVQPWLILAVGLCLGLTGIQWGLPSQARVDLLGKDPGAIRQQVLTESRKSGSVAIAEPENGQTNLARTYRRYFLYSHHPDEMLTLMSLAQMRPSKFDLNPHLFQYGGLFVYPIGGILFVANKLGAIHLSPQMEAYLQEPGSFARLYVVGRLYGMTLGILTALLIYQFARRLADDVSATAGSLLYLSAPGVLVLGHEMKPHAGAALFVLLTMVGLFQALAGRNRRWLWVAAVACGSAMAMVPTNAVFLLSLVAGCGWLRNLTLPGRLALAAQCLLMAVGIYLVFNPYVLVDFKTFLQEARHGSQWHTHGFRLTHWADLAWSVLVPAAGFPLTAIGIAGVFVAGRTYRQWTGLILATLGVASLLLTYQLGNASTDPQSARFFIGFAPVLAVLASLGLHSIPRPPWRLAATLLVLLCNGLISAPILGSFLRDTGSESSLLAAGRWINANVPAGSRIDTPPSPAPFKLPPFAFAQFQLVGTNQPEPDYRIRVGQPAPDPLYQLVFGSTPAPGIRGMSFANPPVFVYRRSVP
ncbi:MAG: hypothetical protein EXS36_18855 [Pedosphaera sp.]|nr:hypothetical protein [Pedosphaera sp.]